MIDLSQNRVGLDGDRVCGFRTIGILRVLHGGRVADILRHLSTQGDGQRLDTSADTQHRDLTVIGQTRDQQFRQIALFVDAT